MSTRSSPSGDAARPSILFSTDRRGLAVVTVPILHSEDVATLAVQDWLAIVNEHGMSAFYRKRRSPTAEHVLFRSKRDRRVYVVARVILGDLEEHIAEYADGDRTNLRRSNLYWRKGGVGGQRRTRSKAPAESTGGDFG